MSVRPASSAPPRNSAAVEDYLERILELINTKGYARVVDIAQALKISAGQRDEYGPASGCRGALEIRKSIAGLALTTAGEALALNITRPASAAHGFPEAARAGRRGDLPRLSRGNGASHQPAHLAGDRGAYGATVPPARDAGAGCGKRRSCDEFFGSSSCVFAVTLQNGIMNLAVGNRTGKRTGRWIAEIPQIPGVLAYGFDSPGSRFRGLKRWRYASSPTASNMAKCLRSWPTCFPWRYESVGRR